MNDILRISFVFKYFLLTVLIFQLEKSYAQKDKRLLVFHAKAYEMGNPANKINDFSVVLFKVKYKLLFEKPFYFFPEDSLVFEKPKEYFIKNNGYFEVPLELNCQYVIEFNRYNYFPTYYCINTKVPKDDNTMLYDFFCQVDLQKLIFNVPNKIIKTKRLCYFNNGKFIGKNEIINPTLNQKDCVVVNQKLNYKIKEKDKKQNELFTSNKKLILDKNGTSSIVIAKDTINKLNALMQKVGKWELTDQNNNKEFTGNYKENKKEGNWLKYFLNDTVEISSEFSNNLPTGNYKMYYENGILKSEGNYNIFQKKFNGIFKKYTEKGELIRYFNYDEDGKKNGQQIIFYNSGKVALTAVMKNDKLEGKAIVYNENGNICCIRYYKNGILVKEEVIDKAYLSRVNVLLDELIKPDSGIVKQLENYYTKLSFAEGNLDDIVTQRNKELAEANLKITEQQKRILIQSQKIKSIEIEKALQQKEIEKQKQRIYFSFAIIVLSVLILLLLLFFYLNSKKKNHELSIKNNIIEKKNIEILDSIEYAKRIQNSILPHGKIVKQYLTNSFILYLPKDIVAGDFYWMANSENADEIFFSVCDCTGHGVPGALVSVVCYNAINKVLNENPSILPSEILDKVSVLIADELNKNSDNVINDGMDSSMCLLNLKTKKLIWAGANNPIWIYHLDGSFTEYKGDKMPVGKNDLAKSFTNHSIQLQTGDTIYLFSDGYADQFGGEENLPEGKKLQKKRFKEFLASIQKENMDEQKIKLTDYFYKWKGNLPQVDDVCVIGVKI